MMRMGYKRYFTGLKSLLVNEAINGLIKLDLLLLCRGAGLGKLCQGIAVPVQGLVKALPPVSAAPLTLQEYILLILIDILIG